MIREHYGENLEATAIENSVLVDEIVKQDGEILKVPLSDKIVRPKAEDFMHSSAMKQVY